MTKPKKINTNKLNQTKVPAQGYTGPALVTPETQITAGSQVNIHATPEVLRGLTTLASALLFAAPAFATQANPENILALSDMFFNYATGTIKISKPDAGAAPQAPTFG